MKSSPRKKNPMNPRRFFWQAIRSGIVHGSIPCWGLPFEAIAASTLLRDRNRKKPKPPIDDP